MHPASARSYAPKYTPEHERQIAVVKAARARMMPPKGAERPVDRDFIRVQSPEFVAPKPAVKQPVAPRHVHPQRDMTRENFAPEGNQLALAAIDALVSGRVRTVVIIGEQGAGKTHLCAAVARDHDDVTVIDNLAPYLLKDAQAAVDARRPLLVSMQAPPCEADWLTCHIRSNLCDALTVRLARTNNFEAIVRSVAPSLPEEAVSLIAEFVRSPSGAVSAAGRASLAYELGNAISLQWLEKACADLRVNADVRRPNMDSIRKAVSQHFGVSVIDLVSARRTKSVVRPRQVAMYLSKKLTAQSLPQIARFYGNRDHTTAIAAIRRVDKILADRSEPEVADAVPIIADAIQRAMRVA